MVRMKKGRTPAGFLVFATLLLLLTPAASHAQRIQEIRFINQPITDILLALAEIS